jgi:hypothetical protein
MRKTVIVMLGIAVLAVVGWGAGVSMNVGALGRDAHPMLMSHAAAAAAPAVAPEVLGKIADARLATAKYAMDVERAKTDGYMIITQMIPNMGYHFLNPKIEGFDVTKPPILVYVKKGDAWQLVAIEWVYCPKMSPKTNAEFGFWHPPLVTLHMWVWHPNPNGIFGEYNPLLTPYNKD